MRPGDERLTPLLQDYRLRLILSSGFNVVRATDGFPGFRIPVETSTSPGYDRHDAHPVCESGKMKTLLSAKPAPQNAV